MLFRTSDIEDDEPCLSAQDAVARLDLEKDS